MNDDSDHPLTWMTAAGLKGDVSEFLPFVASEDPIVRATVASNTDASLEALRVLVRDPDPEVRRTLARCISHRELLLRLAGDADMYVRWAVAEHHNTPPDSLAALAGDGDETVRQAVAAHPNAPPTAAPSRAAEAADSAAACGACGGFRR